MRSMEALLKFAELSAHQWGMATTAQCALNGVTRLHLARLTNAGHLKRLAHGVYMAAGASGDDNDDLRAAWLSTDPIALGEVRIKDRVHGVVVAGSSAARLHDIGDLWADRHEFVSPARRQTQRPEIHFRQRVLDEQDITLVEGLPVMTMERTLADLVESVGDLSLVADALRDASGKRDLAFDRLRQLLAPLAERNGFPKGAGAALLQRMMVIAGVNTESVARRLAADARLGASVAAHYVDGLGGAELERLAVTPEMQQVIRSLQDAVAVTLRDANPELSDTIDIEELSRRVSAKVLNGHAMKEISRAWATSLRASTPPEPAMTGAVAHD
ncbi:type IV toxin-antitoxin system AbiEi family antitoxin domain-containing protein [Knoellia sinensis]|nr:type IV toxin-antitoxin system AbiEi family antitoxin domain-containing protein [Knoellia sinensis]